MESANDLTLPEIGNENNPMGIRVTVELLGLKFQSLLPLDADPEVVGNMVSNTIRNAPKSLRYE